MSITNQILDAINASGASCYRIAKDSGANYVALRQFVRGKQTMTLETADKLAGYLGLKLYSEEGIPKSIALLSHPNSVNE